MAEIGIYLRNLDAWRSVASSLTSEVGWIVFGDYGCPRVTPSLKDIKQVDREAKTAGIRLHYISPKLNQAYIERETLLVARLLDLGLSVSVNDWGLLHKIRERAASDDDIYLGRLLNKSIGDWTWWPIFLRNETEETVRYLLQNNSNHERRVPYLKKMGVKGVEVNICDRGEPDLCAQVEMGYQNIVEKGLKVMAYADNRLLAVSRSCPLKRINNSDKLTADCRTLCRGDYQAVPYLSDEEYAKMIDGAPIRNGYGSKSKGIGTKEEEEARLRQLYPKIVLRGNVLYEAVNRTPEWKNYSKLVYTWLGGKGNWGAT